MTRDEDRLDGDRSAERGGPENLLVELFRSGRVNAIVSWFLVAILGLVLIESVLDFDRLWILFVAVTGLIVLVPPLAHREWRVMLPWEVLVLALAPILVRGLFGGELGTFASYISIAGLALVITVELHVFTPVRMTHWFAIVFVVATTLASAAAWAIARWIADQLLGTMFLSDPTTSQIEANAALMTEFLWVTLAGLVAGVLFDVYFKRRDRRLGRWIRGVIDR
jgi:hypothetical protein